jgi:hypothetical protein
MYTSWVEKGVEALHYQGEDSLLFETNFVRPREDGEGSEK